MTHLLDLNVLTALLWSAHEHHEAAHRWFRSRSDVHWATCAITQLGFVRIVSNPAFSRDALTPPEAVTLLKTNLGQPGHEFWSESVPVPVAIERIPAALQGHRQVTDAYLLVLAYHHGGVFATFDRGLKAIAGDTLSPSLEIVATR